MGSRAQRTASGRVGLAHRKGRGVRMSTSVRDTGKSSLIMGRKGSRAATGAGGSMTAVTSSIRMRRKGMVRVTSSGCVGRGGSGRAAE